MAEKVAMLAEDRSTRRFVNLATVTASSCLAVGVVALLSFSPVALLLFGVVLLALPLFVAVGLLVTALGSWAEGGTPTWEKAVDDFVESCESAKFPVPPSF
jgi:hypothetical protein